MRHDLLHDRLSLGLPQIDADQRLVAENARCPQRLVVVTLAHRAHRIAVGGFDLDYLGAKIGEQPPAERPGNSRAEFQYSIAGEGADFFC